MSPSVAAHYYRRAAFRAGVDAIVGDTRAVFSYDLTTFDVELNPPAAVQVERLCRELRQGIDLAEVERCYRDFAPHVWELVAAFDRYGLLTEVCEPPEDELIKGEDLWRQIDAFAQRVTRRLRPMFYEALRGGRVSRGALVRYAQEYFHVVAAGPRIIAGAFTHANTERTGQMLEEFLVQEIGHERLLARSLAGVGIGIAEARASVPLAETFALTSGLQTLADQEPLTFHAVVFLMEQAGPEFHAAFRTACESVGLGEPFWSPIVAHAEINDAGEHGSISARLLAEVDVVSREEVLVVKKQVVTMLESMVEFERAVLDPRNEIAR